MAVYTPLNDRTLREHLRAFRVGDLIEARGVSAGTINTIYDVNTTRGRYILRILEDRSQRDARFEEALLLRLAERNLTVPQMISAGRRGHIVPITPRQQLSVFRYLPGRELGVFEVRPEHVRQVGEFLAGMHAAALGLRRQRRNRFTPERVIPIVDRCAEALHGTVVARDLRRLQTELFRHSWPRHLPRGIIHGDLFIDNVRFARGRLVGVLDFEMASNGPWAYDLAVTLCDWSFEHDRLLLPLAASLIAGYQEVRALRPVERDNLFELCRFAATRFAVTRIHDFEVQVRPDAQRLYKDYRHFMGRLRSLKAVGPRAFRRHLFPASQ